MTKSTLTHGARVFLALLTSLTLFTSLPRAQQVPTFRARTDLVELDISVLDAGRRPIRGLTAADFSVFEDGKPQEIAIFEAIDVPDPVPPATPWMRDVTPDVTTNEGKVTRLWVLVLDDALIPTDPYAITTSLKVARDIIDRFGPEDLAAIVFTTDSRKAQDFTNDRTKLLATLEQFNPGWANWTAPPKGTRVNPDWQFQGGAIRTLQNIIDTLTVLPHHRKAMIWISGGISSGSRSPLLNIPGRADLDEDRMAELEGSVGVFMGFTEVIDTGRRANIPIYSIHPCGLTVQGQGALDKCTAAASGIGSLFIAAEGTGGRTIAETNDYGPGTMNIFDENKSYYVIGYSPTNVKTDGTFRRLEVKVNRPGAFVRTRTSYTAPKRAVAPPKDAKESLDRATARPIAVTDLPLVATAAPFAVPGSRNATVAIAVGIRQPVTAATSGRVAVTTDLRVSAYTTEGDDKGTQRSTATVQLRPGADGDVEYEAISRFDLPPGRFRLRIAAHHGVAARTGTVMVDVDVPDFAKEPASMSGVVIAATPGRPAAPRELLKPLIPIVPTAQRTFATSDRASAFFHLYQQAQAPATPANVSIKVTDERGGVVITDTATIDAAKFLINKTLRSAPFQYDLPIGRLSAGRYLLTFEATMGATVMRRDVHFEVK